MCKQLAEFQRKLELGTGEILKALPRSISLERFKRIVLTEVKSNDKLLECAIANPGSLFGAIMKTAELGLEPGGALGLAYLIPFGKNVQFMIGYRGMLEIARRSGEIKSISAHCVYEGDFFECRYGMRPRLDHKPRIAGLDFKEILEEPTKTVTASGREITHAAKTPEPPKIIAVYAIAELKSGGFQFEVMGMNEVNKNRLSSKSSNIWNQHLGEMCRKTAIRRLFKYLPVASDYLQILAEDSIAGVEGQNQHNEEVFEGEFSVQESSKSDDVASLISVE